MSVALGNLRRGRLTRAAIYVLPALVALLGAAGVTVEPALGLHDLDAQLDVARRRVGRCETEREEHARFEARGGMATVDAAIARVRDLLPPPMSAVEIHSLVRILARARGIEIAALAVSDPRDTAYPAIGDRVERVDVDLRGRGRLSDVVALAESLSAAGVPASVEDFNLSRTDAADAHFDFRMQIGLHARASEPASSDAKTEGT